jgi:plastocyanin
MPSRTRRPTLSSFLAVCAVTAVATGGAAPPGQPAGVAPTSSSPAAKAVAPRPRLVGSVVLAATGEPLRTGGVVYLEDGPRQPGVATTARIEVRDKRFTPFISVVTTGGTVTFGNGEALTHHVFSPDLKDWDTGYLRKGETASRRLDTPGPIALLCNIHPEMLAYVLVVPSTAFALVGPDGRFAIGDVPEGSYHVTAWAPRLPAVTRVLTVGREGAVTVDFTIPPSQSPAAPNRP